MAPRAAYIHVPFCAARCGYCSFATMVGRDEMIGGYLESLDIELRRLETPRPVDSLYIGGGTPTYLGPEDLRRLLELATHWFVPQKQCEFTIEANPTDLTPEKIGLLKDHGVNRISIGAQSLDPGKLLALERTHAPDDIRTAVARCREAFDSVSLDMIFAAPGETPGQWRQDLHAAVELEPDHLSAYSLTYEPGAFFFVRKKKGLLVEVPEADQRRMLLDAIEILSEAGFEHYETSNFARPGHRSRHNETYWRCEEYFAAGPSAARYVDGLRGTNHSSLRTYIRLLHEDASPVLYQERLSDEDRAREKLVFGLRMIEGVDLERFERETGFSIDRLCSEALERYLGLGMLQREGGRLRLTTDGLLVSDAIWPDFLKV